MCWHGGTCKALWSERNCHCGAVSMTMAHTRDYCTNLLLLTVRWSATTGCFIKALKISSFYRDKKKVSSIKHTHRRRHTATKRQTRTIHAFILSLQGFAIVKTHQWASPEIPYPFFFFFFNEALSRLYTTTPIAPVRALHFQNSAASLTVYFIHFGCCEAPNSILPWSTQCLKAHYSNAGVLWFVLLLVLDIKCNVWFCHHLGKMQVWLYFCWQIPTASVWFMEWENWR